MKIQRPNQAQLNVYQNQVNKQQQNKQKLDRQDRLQISQEAKRLQKDVKLDKQRTAYVEYIKDKVESGEYKINFEETAKQMINFWSNRS